MKVRNLIVAISLSGLLVLLMVVTVAASPAAPAATFTVNSTADLTDDNLADNVCHTSAGSCTLRAAIQQANYSPAADTISLPSGTYSLTIGGTGENASATGDLDILRDLTIQGAGADSAIINAPPFDRVIEISSTAQVTISGVTIRGGNDNGYTGGGILNHGQLMLADAVVRNNYSSAIGGGISNYGVLTLMDTSIMTNSGSFGGGIGNFGTLAMDGGQMVSNTAFSGGGLDNAGWATLAAVNFKGNASTDSSAGSGGGAIANSGTLTVTDSTLISNTAKAWGGGIMLQGPATLLRTSLIDNAAVSPNGYGGGLYQSGSNVKLSLTDVVISGNLGYNEGGGVELEGRATIERAAIVNNKGGAFGAGIMISGTSASLSLINATISANTLDAGAGAGLYNIGTVAITNSTIVSNYAPAFGSAIYNAGSVSALNTVWGKRAGSVAACDGAALNSHGHNLDNDGSCDLTAGGDISHSASLGLRPVALDNGGHTYTHLPLAGGPLIDSGDNAGCPSIDQRGLPRPYDGDHNGSSICDIGAVEYGSRWLIYLPIVLKN